MKIKTKAARRLIILGIAIVVLFGGAGGFYVYRKVQIRQQYAQWRAEGLEAAEQGDTERALDLLRRYLGRYPYDVEVLAKFAELRPTVVSPRNQHLAETIRALRSLVQLDPGRTEARRQLMSLYMRTGYVTEAIQMADYLLSQDARDPEALQVKVEALMQLRRYTEALPLVETWHELKPGELRPTMALLFVMKQVGQPAEKILAVVDESPALEAGQAKTELLKGFARALLNERETAAGHFKAAATATGLNEEIGLSLVQQLDRIQLYDVSVTVLQRLNREGHGARVIQELALRLWERNRFAEVVDLLKDVNSADKKHDSQLLAVHAASLMHVGQAESADAVAKALEQREDDVIAKAWLLVLRQMMGTENLNARELVDACRAALDEQAGNTYLMQFLGEGYAHLGESDLAIGAWRSAAEQNLTWVVPVVRLANVLLDTGRYDSAMAMAQEAIRRAPDNALAAITLARVWSACMENGRIGQPAELLAYVQQIRTLIPQDEQALSIEVSTLAHLGKKPEAAAVVQKALDGEHKLSSQTLLRLAAMSQRWELGVENALFDRCERDYGITPDLSYGRAIGALAAGKADEGLQRLEADRKASSSPDSFEWRLTHARYLDAMQDPAAAKALGALADEHEDNLRLQTALLSMGSVREDKDLFDRTIKRVRSMTGDRALAWRLGRGRWLLDFGSSDSDAQEAATLLNDVVRLSPDHIDARVLLARALEKNGKVTEAIEQLTIAANLNPASTSIGLYLARLLQARGDFELARERLELLARAQLESPEQRRQAAILLAQQGETNQAIRLLEEENRQVAEGQTADLLLANLFLQRRELAKVEAMCSKLMEKPDAAAVQFVANFYALTGRMDQALAVLQKLDGIVTQPGMKELILADFHARTSGMNAAMPHFEAAVKAAPKNAAAWKGLFAARLFAGQADQLDRTLSDAVQHLPGDVSLGLLVRHVAVLREASIDPALRPMVLAVIRDPGNNSGIIPVLQLVTSARESDISVDSHVLRLMELAEQSPRLLPLQLYTAQRLYEMGQFDNAVVVAMRAAQASPGLVEAMHLVTASLISAERWAEALDAARRWREMMPGDPFRPDLVIAECELRMNRPVQAMQQLQPYIDARTSDPARYEQALPMYARAQQAAGSGNAYSLMEPMLQQGARGRQAWMLYALDSLEADEAEVWLVRVESEIPAESTDEFLLLSQIWGELANRTGNEQYAYRARKILEPFVPQAETSASIALALAARREADGQIEEAERLYRLCLKLQPDQPVAQNNLAMVIVRRKGDLNEARRLIEAAIKAWPNGAPLYDTLASVEVASNRLDLALRNIRMAIRLQPRNFDYRLHLVEILQGAQRIDEAQTALRDLIALRTPASRMSKDARLRLETLRQTLLAEGGQAAGS